MRTFTATTIFSFGILIAFFLPWIDLGVYTLNGLEIPSSLDRLIVIDGLFNNNSDAEYLKLSYVLYLIPFLAFINIILDLSKSKFNMWIDEFVIGIVVILLLFIVVKGIHENATSTLSIGYYLTALFSLLGVLFTLIKPRKRVTSPTIKHVSKEEVPIRDKSGLLNQLSQLHSLREKNVITEEIYEQEKTAILAKLQPHEQTKGVGSTAETIDQHPTQEGAAIYNETYDPVYEELFNQKKWYQKPVIWVSASLMVVALIGFTVRKISNSNSTVQSSLDSSLSKTDPVIVNINEETPMNVDSDKTIQEKSIAATQVLTTRDSAQLLYSLTLQRLDALAGENDGLKDLSDNSQINNLKNEITGILSKKNGSDDEARRAKGLIGQLNQIIANLEVENAKPTE